MTETAKTVAFAGTALVLVVLTLATRPNISRDPAVFDDSREPFYPELVDPSVPQALEVIEFDEATNSARPFRVQNKDGRWTIPSHHDYPADAADRLRRTAGAILGLTKDSVVSDQREDHAALGVADPFESQSSSKGWGTRVKLFDKSDNVVADLIIGKEVPDRPGFRYVRIPGRDRTYAVQTKDLDLSIKFTDWIDTALLETSSFDLEQIEIKDYKVDLAEGKIKDRGTVVLEKDKDSAWQVHGLGPKEETNKDKASALASAIADLRIVGVRQKPPGLKPDLRLEEGQALAQTMQARGFYPTRSGEVVSNEGEVVAETKDGLVYTLRFGGTIFGAGDEVTAGKEQEKAAEEKKEEKPADAKADEKKADGTDSNVQENRFLLVSVAFDESKFPPIPDPPKTEPAPSAEKKAAPKEETKASAAKDAKAEEKKPEDKPAQAKADDEAKNKEDAAQKQADEEVKRKREERELKIKRGQERAKELSDRFANWFYVIPNESFKKIRLSRADLVQEKKEEKPADAKEEEKPDSVVPAAPKVEGASTSESKPAEKPAMKEEKPSAKPTPAKAKEAAVKAVEKPAPAEAKEAKPKEDAAKAAPAKKAG